MTNKKAIGKIQAAPDPSRRAFLKKAGIGLGVAVGTVALGPQMAWAAGEETPVSYPFPYKPLDVEAVRVRAHDQYYVGGCAFGAFSGVLLTMQDELGGPFYGIPVDMLRFGGGGVAGWGTTCGAILGASAAINLVTEVSMVSKVVNELVGWYTTTPLPTKASNDAAAAGKFSKVQTDAKLTQTIAHSPLCHVSAATWMDKVGKDMSSPERKERCARATADTAAHAVELLNAVYNGTFAAEFTLPSATAGCLECHSGDQHGKMDCLDCHDGH